MRARRGGCVSVTQHPQTALEDEAADRKARFGCGVGSPRSTVIMFGADAVRCVVCDGSVSRWPHA